MSSAASNNSDDDRETPVVNAVQGRVHVSLETIVDELDTFASRVAIPDPAGIQTRSPWSDMKYLRKPQMQAYIDLALTASTPANQYHINVQRPANQETLLEEKMLVYRDVDSALVFAPDMPWRGSWSILMRPMFMAVLGKLDVYVNFVVRRLYIT